MSTVNDQPQATVIDLPLGHEAIDQAAAWIAALDADHVSAGTLQQFRQWVNAAPEHIAEFERLAKRWEGLNLLTQIVVPSEQVSARNTTGKQRAGVNRGSHWLSAWQRPATAMAVTLLAVFTLLLMPWGGEQSRLYITGIGEQKTVVLSDNSTVQLNTSTRLKIDYSEQRRGIHLLQGEAHFQVAHNPDRPFEVYSGAGVVRAVGTAFSVYLNHQQVEVLVNEGTVEVDELPTAVVEPDTAATTSPSQTPSPGQTPPPHTERLRIKAGTQATFERHQPLAVVLDNSVELDKKLAWRKGSLVFTQEPLQALVDEVGRYTSVRIVIADSKLRALRVGGVFEVGNAEAVLDALVLGFGVQVERVDEQLVYLSLAATSPGANVN